VAVEALQIDKTFFTSRVADMVAQRVLGRNRPSADGELALPTLTSREREIVQLLAEARAAKKWPLRLC